MCHQAVRPKTAEQNPAPGEAPVATPQRDNAPDSAGQEENVNLLNGPNQSDTVSVSDDQQVGEEDKDYPTSSHKKDTRGLRFSSSGDFVGFVSPSHSADEISTPDVPLGETLHPNRHVAAEGSQEAGDAQSLIPLTTEVVNGETSSGSKAEGLENCNSSCLTVPQNGDADYEDFDGC